jgi:Xaa-Pro aminopeptidase
MEVLTKVVSLGSTGQIISAASGPFGKPVVPNTRWQDYPVAENDVFTLMVKGNGPGGMYGEIGRSFFIGSAAPSELLDAYETCKEAQKLTVNLLKAGARPAEIWNVNNEFMTRHGYPPETRLYAHGQGYDLVERPAIRWDEPMVLKTNMNIAVHPTIMTSTLYAWVCDNYLISKTGAGSCLHKTPQTIFTL